MFETSDFLLERDAIRQQLQYGTPPTFTADEVCRIFNKKKIPIIPSSIWNRSQIDPVGICEERKLKKKN